MNAHDRTLAMAGARRTRRLSRPQSRRWAGCSRSRSACTGTSRRVVLVSLLPIALGHALSIAVVARRVRLALGLLVDRAHPARRRGLHADRLGALALRSTATATACASACRPALLGLAVWSFLMATAHGAGLMLIPVLMPLCLAGARRSRTGADRSSRRSRRSACTPLAMLATIAAIARSSSTNGSVSAFLRRGWINVDLVWTLALAAAGALLLLG